MHRSPELVISYPLVSVLEGRFHGNIYGGIEDIAGNAVVVDH